MKKGNIIEILKISIWILIIGWMSIVVIDYVKVKNTKDPLFCIKNEIIEEEDGNIYICTGLGYKYYNVVKDTYVMRKFIPFWTDPELDAINE